MNKIKSVTKIEMHADDLAIYQKSVDEASFGTSMKGILETFYNIELAVDSRLPKGFIFVHERDVPVPKYMSISAFRHSYGTI